MNGIRHDGLGTKSPVETRLIVLFSLHRTLMSSRPPSRALDDDEVTLESLPRDDGNVMTVVGDGSTKATKARDEDFSERC
jgi:hypothetical protein